mmetsp:Transcript_21022/g.48616  ORF Transcript_21022/g.48616 Transcript_21022/m.48616 type:complete len:107 (-) Transcript_21022:457-777(-)
MASPLHCLPLLPVIPAILLFLFGGVPCSALKAALAEGFGDAISSVVSNPEGKQTTNKKKNKKNSKIISGAFTKLVVSSKESKRQLGGESKHAKADPRASKAGERTQ